MSLPEDFWSNLWEASSGTIVFGMIGIMLTLLGLKILTGLRRARHSKRVGGEIECLCRHRERA